ncbi:MAG: alcohol dehydrogenase catalytic domain-containing protein [Anaerolineae bacterium]|nr:alcohol dehydrogenase catalytic domain-containing protein [Anaerolineae bacterium]
MGKLPETMKAIAVTAYGDKLRVITVPVPKPGINEVLVHVRASGFCSTDTHLLQGRQPLGTLPRVLGHETAGDIVELGPYVDDRWKIGDRVSLTVDVTCGACRFCRTGQTQLCKNMKRMGFERDGGHAEYVAVPTTNLVKVPETITYEQACILPDAVACTYHSIMAQGKLGMGQTIAILGAGGLGVHGVQIARQAGARVIATGRRPERLQAAEKYGAIAVNTNTQSLEDVVNEMTRGEGVDVVMDNIGNNASIKQGLGILRPGGKFLVVAYMEENFAVPAIPLFSKEFELIGCRASTRQDLVDVVRYVEEGVIEPVIGAYFDLEEVDQAVECLENGQMIGRIVFTRKEHYS